MRKRMMMLRGWLLGAVVLLGFAACSSGGGDDLVADEGQLVAVPDLDTWVTDDDIQEEDLDQLVDLSVKVERMRQEFVLMLSNNDEGDKLFCGVGPQTDIEPTIRIFTEMMLKEEEYAEALSRLDGSDILKPSGTRGKLKDLWDIFTTGKTEAQAEKEKVQEILTQNNVYGNAEAQQQLYDFYCSQEPDYAKKIGASDAKDFFNKLNNGELNSYMLNISHIWRDKGILEADKTNSAVGDYAYTAFTGKAEYLNSAYRVSSKVAVAAGDLYFTAIDDYVGGYGSKIMDFGDAIKNKITKLKLMKKVLEGKPDWQGWNSYIVGNLKDDIKSAISEALGDSEGFGKDLVEMVTEEILDWVEEQCTSEDEGDGSEEAQEKKAELAEEEDVAILNIETDFTSQGKMILVTDEATGKVHVATPTYDGHVTITTTPGTKLVTVIKKNGERLTKRVTVVAGSNTLIIKSEQAPYLDLNPSSIWLEDEAGSETCVILTNCKYVKLRIPNKEEWWNAQVEVNGSAGRGIHLRVTCHANLEENDRSGSFILEGYLEKDDEKAAITKNVKFTQSRYSPELAPIDVSPTSLSFGAQGGEQIVTVDYKNYKYYGGFNDEGSDDWLKVVINGDGTLTVIASPNNTGIERTGTVYAFATDLDQVETLDQAAFKIIPVTQSSEGSYVITSVYIEPTIRHTWGKLEEGSWTNDYWGVIAYRKTIDNLTITNAGNDVIHISGSYNGVHKESDSGNEEITLNMEIENFSQGCENWIIKSLNVDSWYTNSGTEYDGSWWHDEKINLQAYGIPYASKSNNGVSFLGKQFESLSGLDFTCSYKGKQSSGQSYSYQLVLIDDEYNSISVGLTLSE